MSEPLQETMPGNSLKSLRTILFQELMDLRNDKVDTSHAIAVSKISSQVITSYKAEIDAVNSINNLKDKNMAYAHVLANTVTPDITTVIKEK